MSKNHFLLLPYPSSDRCRIDEINLLDRIHRSLNIAIENLERGQRLPSRSLSLQKPESVQHQGYRISTRPCED